MATDVISGIDCLGLPGSVLPPVCRIAEGGMRTRLISLGVAVAAAGLGAFGVQASLPPQSSASLGLNLIHLDVYATVRGIAVDDLHPGEITVSEDGVAQTIDGIEYVTAPDEAGVSGIDLAGHSGPGDRRPRIVVVFLDAAHSAPHDAAVVNGSVAALLDHLLAPDDLVAVTTPQMAAGDLPFGRKGDVVAGLLRDEWRASPAARGEQDEARSDGCFGGTGDPGGDAAELSARQRERVTLDALDDLVAQLGRMGSRRKAVIVVSDGWRLFRPSARLSAGRVLLPPGTPATSRSSSSSRTAPRAVEDLCEAEGRALAGADHAARLRQLGEQANRNTVTFYPVYVPGVAVVDNRPVAGRARPVEPDAAGARSRQNSLSLLAASTDGDILVGPANREAFLRRIREDLSSYYLIRYRSTNVQLDGRFRPVSVQVSRPGVRTRTRPGYRGPTPETLLATVLPRASGSRPAAAAGSALTGRRPFRIRTAVWSAGSARRFWVVGELDAATRRTLAWTAGARAEVTVVAADGRIVLARSSRIPPGEATFATLVPDTGGLDAGEYAVGVSLAAAADPGQSLSDLARVVVPADQTSLGEPLLYRRGPSTGPRYVRTADPTFNRHERLRLELPTERQGRVLARVVDRTGRPLPIPLELDEREAAPGGYRWVVVDLAVAPLAIGEYAIEASMGLSEQRVGFRVAP